MAGGIEKEVLKQLRLNHSQSLPLRYESIIAQIDANAKMNPFKEALVTSKGSKMSYSELIDAASRTASSIEAEGAKPGDHIGLLAEPGIEAIIGILGILYCRCGYVPLDPDFAPDRFTFMADDSGSNIILVSHGVHKIINGATAIVCFQEIAQHY